MNWIVNNERQRPIYRNSNRRSDYLHTINLCCINDRIHKVGAMKYQYDQPIKRRGLFPAILTAVIAAAVIILMFGSQIVVEAIKISHGSIR